MTVGMCSPDISVFWSAEKFQVAFLERKIGKTLAELFCCREDFEEKFENKPTAKICLILARAFERLSFVFPFFWSANTTKRAASN